MDQDNDIVDEDGSSTLSTRNTISKQRLFQTEQLTLRDKVPPSSLESSTHNTPDKSPQQRLSNGHATRTALQIPTQLNF